MSGSGRGGNNRKHRQRFSGKKDDLQKYDRKKNTDNLLNDGKFETKTSFEKNNAYLQDRPRWTAPVLPANPITTPDCPWCGKPIKEIATAIADKDSGKPIHFDCVLARVAESVSLDTNESVCYIGGGRFGVVHFNNPPDTRNFTIKRILEWEVKDNSTEWRRPISDYFSIT
jgi:hypothetical protein